MMNEREYLRLWKHQLQTSDEFRKCKSCGKYFLPDKSYNQVRCIGCTDCCGGSALTNPFFGRKLNKDQVQQILKIKQESNLSNKELAKQFNVSSSTIFDIIRGDRWAA
jgi:hypothetical protein